MKRKQINKCVMKDNRWFIVLTFISIGLLIASFIVPPLGVIDGSVLAAVGEIFAFAALGTLLKALETGVAAKIKHKDTTFEIDPDEDEEDKQL